MLTIKNLEAINEVFKRLNNLRRWTEFITEGKYDEISKQSLNCIISFVLATEAENEGQVIVWERFPKIALYRAFQKAYVNYDLFGENSIYHLYTKNGTDKHQTASTLKILTLVTAFDYINKLKIT